MLIDLGLKNDVTEFSKCKKTQIRRGHCARLLKGEDKNPN